MSLHTIWILRPFTERHFVHEQSQKRQDTTVAHDERHATALHFSSLRPLPLPAVSIAPEISWQPLLPLLSYAHN
ncbi:hypothetical protein RR48_06913 [Papilio machaon]|uniref:Uncharacterized protein n=1 Tax=Papilio machaon TaxID=76193 RepID=A0A194RB70_PAPMA|nr:hypothetical protein RR48_06913 [Papilio machaon]